MWGRGLTTPPAAKSPIDINELFGSLTPSNTNGVKKKPKVKVCVIAIGLWGDLYPHLNLYAHLREVIEPTFFVDEVYLKETEARGFEAVAISSFNELTRKNPNIFENQGRDFMDGWLAYMYDTQRVETMTNQVIEADLRIQFDMIACASNADFLVYLLRDKMPLPYLRTEVVENTPNYESHPWINCEYVPRFLMPLLWETLISVMHKKSQRHGYDKLCTMYDRPIESLDDYQKRLSSTPVLLGNDQAFLRPKEAHMRPSTVTITPRWRPLESAQAQARASRREAQLQQLISEFIALNQNTKNGVGLLAFGSMILSEHLACCLRDWIVQNIKSSKDFAIIVQCYTSCTGADRLAPLLPENHPRILKLTGLVNHDFLFRQVSWLICHGGVGTIQNARRARLPTLICPSLIDQHQAMQQLISDDLSVQLPNVATIETDHLNQALPQLMNDKSVNWSTLPETTPEGKLLTPNYDLIQDLFFSVYNSPPADLLGKGMDLNGRFFCCAGDLVDYEDDDSVDDDNMDPTLISFCGGNGYNDCSSCLISSCSEPRR